MIVGQARPGAKREAYIAGAGIDRRAGRHADFRRARAAVSIEAAGPVLTDIVIVFEVAALDELFEAQVPAIIKQFIASLFNNDDEE